MVVAPPALDLPLHPNIRVMAQRGRGLLLGLTRRRLRRGTFTGVVDLQAAIKRDIAEHDLRAKPFVWTKPAAQILSRKPRA
jgi:hypothetical protein